MHTVRIERDGDRVVIESGFRDKELVKMVPGTRWSADAHRWHAPLSWATCKALRGVFGDRLEVGPKLASWSHEEYNDRVRPAAELRDQSELPEWTLKKRIEKHYPDLFPFQQVGVAFLVSAESALLGDEMGTGKTVQTIAALDLLNAFPALVVCPNSVKRVWEREVKQWAPHLSVAVVAGSAKKRREAIYSDADVVVVNWEALRGHSRLAPFGSIELRSCSDCDNMSTNKPTSCERCERDLNEVDWVAVVADEAHRAKSPRAKQTRALWAVSADADHRYALTGTPIANTPDELWSVMRFVAPHEYPAKSAWVDRYCAASWNPFGGLDIVGLKPETSDELHSVLDPRFIRRPKKAVLHQLPDKLPPQVRYVEQSSKERKAYESVRKEMLAMLEDGSLLTATSPLTQTLRLTQLASSYGEVDEEGDFKLTEPSCKLDALADLLDELAGEPLVCFAESRQLIQLAERRAEKLGVESVSVHGEVGERAREVAIERFQEGHARLFLGTVGAGGEGITLTRASTVCFLQRSWSMVANQQAEDRLHRIGQERPVTVIDLVASDTIEDDRLTKLDEKAGRLEELVRDEETLRKLLGAG